MINGGTNGLEDRLVRWKRCRAAVGLPPGSTPGEEELQIMQFQRHHGLAIDGVAGSKTFAAIRAVSIHKNRA